MNMQEYKYRCENMGLAHPIPAPLEVVEKLTGERDALLKEVAELRAEVQRLSQIAKY
jgi:hypothetical protein